ncbi:NifB/NifX family molybdenum-iron cluster-binding protein [Desulfitobacterium hafniense]|uniref:NifB/NifX family molybdenum-iron cluster-binding protein n=1 Tax=Desulfitobacterium hafniense TaxID=49338 RepID=UPI0003A5DA51|nr:NifB/NifX family molybdenum-iron cluster-binding protein [Desulfitobacterium hafniense]
MRVGFATSDGLTIDSHFATAPGFEIYAFTMDSQGVYQESLAPKGLTESEDKVDERIQILNECTIVYCTQIGGPAAARLVQSGIHPIKVPEGTPIVDEVRRLDQLLSSQKLPPWLKKKLNQEGN